MVGKAKDWFPEDKATNEWLDSMKKSSRHTYLTAWKYFVEYTGMTGDQILQNRKTDTEFAWEKRLLEFKRWFTEEKGKADKTAVTATGVIRSFFDYHRLPLKFRRSESTQLGEATPKYEDYRFSRDDLKKMCDFADLEEKYVITAGKSFGLRASDFLALTRGDLEPYLDRPVPISLGEYFTKKEKVKAFPFIDTDALPLIKLMIEKMDREGRTAPNERMLTYSHEIQLSRTLKRVTDKAGIKYGNKRVRFHNLRKFLIDRLSSHMSSEKWKQIVGKKISEGAYVSPDSLREDYSRAMPDTCFTTAPEGDIGKLAKREALLAFAKSLGCTEEDLQAIGGARRGMSREAMKRIMRGVTIDDEIKHLEKLIAEKQKRTEHNGGSCLNGDNCPQEYVQIPEEQLLGYLREGYQIVHRLNNGEVIVKR